MSLTDWSDRLLFGHRIGLSCYRNFGFVTGKHENGSRIARGIAFEQLSGMVIHQDQSLGTRKSSPFRRGFASSLVWKKKWNMRDWSPDADSTKSGWLRFEATLVTMAVILGYAVLGWAVYGWLASHLA